MDTLRQQFGAANSFQSLAARTIKRCRKIAEFSDCPGETTRTFLSPAMRMAMNEVGSWMEAAGCTVTIDAAGNLRGLYAAATAEAPRLMIGSHLDTVPNAGAFDGVLGVMLALTLVEVLDRQRLPYAIELIAFSEEEGVRFGVPFIGSRALAGLIDRDLLLRTDANRNTVLQAIQEFGLEPSLLSDAVFNKHTKGYLEFHIEQGPVLEDEKLSLGVVESIAGQTRGQVLFYGVANHAGTTPMHLRSDALAGAAEWILEVERVARSTEGLVATVGCIEAKPGAGNIVPGEVQVSLDVRHAVDALRRSAVRALVDHAIAVGSRRGLRVEWASTLDQQAVPMDSALTHLIERAVQNTGVIPLRMVSGAGHDAMILAPFIPSAMVFLRSPGGLSHHPNEDVFAEDVERALAAGIEFLKLFRIVKGFDA